MKFFIEVPPLTGMSDVMDVQAIGQLEDGIFVVEAETADEATEKLLDLLSMRVNNAQFRRPATEDESDEFAKKQCESYLLYDDVVRIREKYAKGNGDEQTN
ncbi:MAG: hypothetical protein WB680_10315 [Candidatus Acidiferrales bacterium]